MRLRGALLGAGNIALRGHAPQWSTDEHLRQQVQIAAVADISATNREAARAIFPEARLYGRAEDLLAEEDLDFCDICTPPFTHRPLIEAAAARGLGIICEKPLAPSLGDALRIAQVVREAEIAFQPCHQYHHSPQWMGVRELLPRIGQLYLAEYKVQRLAANEGNPNWAPLWRTERDLAGGGILVDHGAHIFYQLRAVLGEPRTVQATVRTLLHQSYGVEDTAFVTLDYGDSLAEVSLTWAARCREIRFRFVGQRGEIVGDEERVRLHADTTQEIAFGGGMSQNSSHSEWYAPLLGDFVRRVRSGDRGSDGMQEAVYVTRLIARAYESSALGRVLSLNGSAEKGEKAMQDLVATVMQAPSVAPRPAPVAGPGVAQSRRRLGWAIRGSAVAVLLALLAWTFHDISWGELGQAMASAHLGWIGLAAAVNLGVLLFQAVRWLAVVRPVSRAATLGHSFKAMIVGFTASMVVPARAGELARAHYFALKTGLSRTSIIGSIVLDHLVNAAGLLAGLALLPLFIGVPGWIQSGGWIALAVFVTAALAVVALRPMENTPSEGPRDLPARRIAGLLAKVRHGLSGVRSPRALGTSFGASLVAWTLEVGVVGLSMRAVGLHLPLAAVFLVLLAVNLALVFPLAPPGNIGTLELGATLPLLGFGVAKEEALAFALCYHLLQVVPIAILGVAFAGRLGFGRLLDLRPVGAADPA